MIDKKLRIVASDSGIDLNSYSSGFTTVYSYSGEGQLVGFSLDFDSDNIICKLEIDSNTIFELDCSILDRLFSEDWKVEKLGIGWDSSANRLTFSSPNLLFRSNFTISAKANTTTTSRDCDRYLISYTKEDELSDE